jgi:hypothetical protein
MNIIDHRILIPRSPEAVWNYISEIGNNTAWQVDCTNLSFLTTRHTGVGVRWRYTTKSGREYVAETTAWYDGLGYEYTLVDGTSYKSNIGRIRLQELAEGTVVQWTFTFEVGGLLGGMRSSIGGSRQTDGLMVDSLKKLWKVLNQAIPEEKNREVKSLMRDAPNYESRAQYKPRHPSAKPSDAPEGRPVPLIPEPPIADDDTRPSIARPEPIVSSDAPFMPPRADERRFERPAENPEPDKRATSEAARVPPVPAPEPEKLPVEPSLPALTKSEPAPAADVHLPAAESEAIAHETEKAEPERPSVTTTSTAASPLPPLPDTSKMDTREISVFELFGLPKPSETQEMKAVVVPPPAAEVVETPRKAESQPVSLPVAEAAEAPTKEAGETDLTAASGAAETPVRATTLPVSPPLMATDVVLPRRIGLRIVLRRKRVKLRRPE